MTIHINDQSNAIKYSEAQHLPDKPEALTMLWFIFLLESKPNSSKKFIVGKNLLKSERVFVILIFRCSVSTEHSLSIEKNGGCKLNEENTFGEFVRDKRTKLDPPISLRKMAELLDISPVYMSNIETGRDPAPKDEVLENLARILKLGKKENEHMYDMAAASKNYVAIPGDLPEYITTHEYAKIALRVAKDVDATDEEWIDFIEKLKKRSKEDKLE